jgi:hypothetical protein
MTADSKSSDDLLDHLEDVRERRLHEAHLECHSHSVDCLPIYTILSIGVCI